MPYCDRLPAVKSRPQERLDKYARKIRSLYKQSLARDRAALDARIAVGHELLNARREFGEGHAGDKEFGKWCTQESLPFTQQWGWWLMEAAQNELAIKEYVTTTVVTSEDQLPGLKTLIQEVKRQQVQPVDQSGVPFPDGKYRCLVIDPPWPMEKLSRDVRPKQGPVLAYQTMELEEIAALPVTGLAFEDGCHVYLWVTHHFLRDGLNIFDHWGVQYECLMTWRKNVGITPFSWMYDTEHVLFGRIGTLTLAQLGLRLSFDADVAGHSVKPDVFYERVALASPGPRLEMFARASHEGFEPWGKEAHHVA
jgi:N6-adenosine-specific RNA methylase IME4